MIILSSKKYVTFFNNQKTQFIRIFFLIGVLLRANAGADENQFRLRQYYPIIPELSWEYLVEENNNSFAQHVKCFVLSDSQFTLSTNSMRQTRYFFNIDSNLVSLSHISVHLPYMPFDFTIHISPNMPIFNFAGDIGDTWIWSGYFVSLMHRKKVDIHTEIRGFEKIKIKNQDIQCLEIVSEIVIDGKVDTLFAFYACDIGLIKQVSTHQKKALTHFTSEEVSNDLVTLLNKNDVLSNSSKVEQALPNSQQALEKYFTSYTLLISGHEF